MPPYAAKLSYATAIVLGVAGVATAFAEATKPNVVAANKDTMEDDAASLERQIRVERRTPAYWRVTFDNPPFNIFGPETIPQLEAVITAIENDPHLKVVVFDSAVPDFFLTHYNFIPPLSDSTSLRAGPTGLHPLPDMLVRLSRSLVVSICLIRGRATGVGSELALASDMRFASRERAILSQWEVGAALVPGGGRWRGFPGSWAEAERSRSYWVRMVSTARWRNGMATLIARFLMISSTISSRHSLCAFQSSIERPSRTLSGSSTLRACPLTRKLPPDGMGLSRLFSVPRPSSEFNNS
jgi:hypothetical protein